MSAAARDTSQTMQERIATTHVRDLDVDVDAMAAISNLFRVTNLFRGAAEKRFLDRHELSARSKNAASPSASRTPPTAAASWCS